MQAEFPYYGPTGTLDHLNEYRIEGEYVLIGESLQGLEAISLLSLSVHN